MVQVGYKTTIMIQITPINQPATTFNSVWIKNLTIVAPKPKGKVTAYVTLVPYNTTSSVMSAKETKVSIPDVLGLSATSSYVANVMENMCAYIQDQLASGSIAL